MGLTITEKILAAHAGRAAVEPGEFVMARVDVVMGNDGSTAGALPVWRKIGAERVFDPERVAIVFDHFVPNKDVQAADLLAPVRQWVRAQGLPHFFDEGRPVTPVLCGRAWVFGDDVNTDVIMPGKYLTVRDPALLAPHVMEGLDPEFTTKARPGDLVVAGKNFGCGSSRETAPAALRAFGLSAVVAVSFARIFLRSAVNIGLPVFECPAAVADVRPGEELEIDPASGRIRNLARGTTHQAAAVPPFMRELIERGGLVPYTRARLTTGVGVTTLAPAGSLRRRFYPSNSARARAVPAFLRSLSAPGACAIVESASTPLHGQESV